MLIDLSLSMQFAFLGSKIKALLASFFHSGASMNLILAASNLVLAASTECGGHICSFYKGEGDCYHSDWAVPCSHAGSYSNCEASGGCWFDNHNVEVVPIHSTSLECIKGFQFDSDCFHSNWEVPMSHSGSKSTCEASCGCWIYSSLEATAAFNGTMSV